MMMKRVFAFFSLLILLASCSQEVDLSPAIDSSQGDSVSFTASMISLSQTKAEVKTTWGDDDQIAIFIEGDEETPYCYDVNSAGEMSPAEGVEPLLIFEADQTQTTYLAFYPYDATLTSAEDYRAASSTEVDLMSSVASGAGQVAFTFAHDAALLYFSFMTSCTTLSATITVGSTSYSIGFEMDDYVASGSIFVEPIDDVSGAMLKVVADSQSSYYILDTDFESWNQGCSYLYTGLKISLATGSGSEEDPYLIYDAEDLRKVGSGSDGWSLDAHYKLVADVDLGGIDAAGEGVEANEWSAIGTESDPFVGTFDGDGFTISGLYINQPAIDYQGLFGYVSGATIEKFTVSGSVTGAKYAGSIVGLGAESSMISFCLNEANVSGTNTVGGIAGAIDSSSVIKGCGNVADIETSGYSAGGITGSLDSYSYVVSCYNLGDVSGGATIGGIAGGITTFSFVAASYSAGGVSGSNTLGGLAGLLGDYGWLNRCYYNSEVYDGSSYGASFMGTVSSISSSNTEYMLSSEFVAALNDYAYDFNEAYSSYEQAVGWSVVDLYPVPDASVVLVGSSDSDL